MNLLKRRPESRGQKWFRFGALTVAMTLALAACGSGDGQDSSETTDSLTYWSMWKEGEPQQQVLSDAIDAFTTETGIKVDVQWQGRDVLKKVLPTLQGGNVPDLVDQESGPIQSSLVGLDAAHDLTDAYEEPIPGEEGQTVRSVIPEPYIDLMTASDGTLFMVPYELISSAIWFDKARLPDVENDPPQNWDDFTALLSGLKADGHNPLAQDGDIGIYNAYWTVWGLIRALGAGNANALVADTTGAAWDDPRVLEVGKKIEEMVAGGYFIPGYDGSKYPAIQQKWADGDADFLINGTWAPSETSSYQEPGFEISSFQYPNYATDAPGNGSVEVGMLGFAVPESAKNYDNAKKFMAWMLSKESVEGISTVTENLTPREDIPAPDSLKNIKETIDNAPMVHRPYDGIDADFPNYFPTVFQPVNNKLIFGKITGKEWVDSLKAATIKYWGQHG